MSLGPLDLAVLAGVGGLGARWALTLVLALVEQRAQGARFAAWEARRPALRVAVLVPAYNEARVIAACVRGVARSDHPADEIWVIDDGSVDGTAEVVEALMPDFPTLRLLRQPQNGGKARALAAGLAACQAEVVVTVDADTVLDPACLRRLVATLEADDLAAVASNVKVGNPVDWVARWQALEYAAGLNVDRRAQVRLGIVTTMPGAASAWRRELALACGGFPPDTLAEDTDLTLALLRAGHRCGLHAGAFAFTEAPQTLGALIRQRRRWLWGNLQCARKHSDAWWRPAPWRFRLLTLPNLWVGHLLVYALLPLILVWSALLTGAPHPAHAALGASLFVIDLAGMLAFLRVERLSWRLLLDVPAQRVVWPWLSWLIFAMVGWRVLWGLPARWDKLERSGQVTGPG